MVPLRRTMVLRPQTSGPIRGAGLEVCDRAGAVLARAAGDRPMVVSDPAGQAVLVLDGHRSPIRVLDPGGGVLGLIELRSRGFATPRIAVSGPAGEPLATLGGPRTAMRLTDASGALVADVLREGGAWTLVVREDPAEPLRSLLLAALIGAYPLAGRSRSLLRDRTAATRRRTPSGEFRLHDTRTMLIRPAVVFTGVGIAGVVAGHDAGPYWYVAGAAGLAVGAMFAVLAICFPLRVTLSAAGLTTRGWTGSGVLPAAAIEAVGIVRAGRVDYVTLWYDTAAVPALPPAFARYLRAMPPSAPGRIHAGVINDPDGVPRTPELYRVVRETGLGEWRDHP